MSISEDSLELFRDAPGFSERFTGRFEEQGKRIFGLWKLSHDDTTWKGDSEIMYRRNASR